MALLLLVTGCSGGNVAAPDVPTATGGNLRTSVAQHSSLSLAPQAAAVAHTTLYSFKGGTDGKYPLAGLVDVDGVFYGTTQAGGGTGCSSSLGCGTVFKITKSGVETVIHRFAGGTADGGNPAAGLIYLNGLLYGTTEYGGSLGEGTVFSVSTSGAENVLHSFTGGSHDGDGQFPVSGLINVGGTLYGASKNGGTNGSSLGAIYKITPTGNEGGIYSFQGQADGYYPMGGLVAINGDLYGTTFAGGFYDGKHAGAGTVFAVSTSGSKFRELHTFSGGSDSGSSVATLTDINGELYGTTGGQGIGTGTVFKINSSGTGYQILHTFQGGATDGYEPLAGLTNVSGVLFGTTWQDPANDDGCVFKITTSGTESVVTGFKDDSTDGVHPQAGLLDDTKLYGTTTGGGTGGYGTVFAVTP